MTATILRQDTETGGWEAVLGTPDPRLAGIVAGSYHGWTETAAAPVLRREVPKAAVPLILNFGPAFRVTSPADRAPAGTAPELHPYRSFLAGMTALPALTLAETYSHCLQANLTPLGAYRVLGLGMHSLTDRVVELADILGPAADLLVEELAGANGWPQRFRLLDAALLARMDGHRPPTPEIAHALARLEQSGGALSIGGLAAELDISRRRLIDRFHEQVGLPPKALARILRFNRAVGRLTLPGARPDLADIALACGYYDQAHFNREFRALAGVTPHTFLAEGGTIHELGEFGGVQELSD